MDFKVGSLNTDKPTNGDVGCLDTNHVSTIKSTTPITPIGSAAATLGRYLARLLVQIGVSDVLVGCCNELNAGYAADGYARSCGVGACAVTFIVGGSSILNAISGAYCENLPIICIVGGPNSNDYGTNRILHHSIGLPDFSQELHCFQTVTCYQAIVNSMEDAHEKIDTAILTTLKESKPVYISISYNLSSIPHPTFSHETVPFCLEP
ncbi:hypothetical protein MKW98_004295, partial [Papaver atlanticum]